MKHIEATLEHTVSPGNSGSKRQSEEKRVLGKKLSKDNVSSSLPQVGFLHGSAWVQRNHGTAQGLQFGIRIHSEAFLNRRNYVCVYVYIYIYIIIITLIIIILILIILIILIIILIFIIIIIILFTIIVIIIILLIIIIIYICI